MMIIMDRLERLKYIFDHDDSIRSYYIENFNVSEFDFTYESVMDYSPGGLGEIADCILEEGNYLFR